MRCLAMLLLIAPLQAQEQSAAEPDPVRWAIAGVPEKARPGEVVRVAVSAKIEEPWHVHSMKRVEAGPEPLTFTTIGPQVFRLAGIVDAPVALTQFEDRFGMEVEFYLGEVEFEVPLEVVREAKPGKGALALAVRYQACDNKKCLTPKTAKLTAEIGIEGQ